MGTCHNNTECTHRPGLQRQPRLRGAAPTTGSAAPAQTGRHLRGRHLRDRRLPRQQRLQQRPGLPQQHLRGLHGGQPVRHRPALSVGRLHDGQLPRRRPTAPPAKICTTNNCTALHHGRRVRVGLRRGPPLQRPGACIAGNCRAKGDCAATGPICNTRPRCSAALHRRRIAAASTEYGTGRICIGGVCVAGNCHTTARTAPRAARSATSPAHACDGCTLRRHLRDAANYGAELTSARTTPASRATATPPPTATTPRRSATATPAACAARTRDCTDRLRHEPRLLGRRLHLGQLQQLRGVRQQPALREPRLRGLHRRRAGDAQADTTYGAMHICLGRAAVRGRRLPRHLRRVHGQARSAASPRRTPAAAAAARTPPARTTRRPTAAATSASTAPASPGDCHDTSNDCTAGKLCGVSTAHTCGLRSGARRHPVHRRRALRQRQHLLPGHLQVGNCHATSSDCTGGNAGLICGVDAPPHSAAPAPATRSARATRSTAAHDHLQHGHRRQPGQVRERRATRSNATTTPAGPTPATSAARASAWRATAAATPTARTTRCSAMGYACTGNTCSHCDAIAGNNYYVDPVNGNDTRRPAAACRAAPPRPPALQDRHARHAGHRHLRGRRHPGHHRRLGHRPRGLAAGDSLPITLQPNVRSRRPAGRSPSSSRTPRARRTRQHVGLQPVEQRLGHRGRSGGAAHARRQRQPVRHRRVRLRRHHRGDARRTSPSRTPAATASVSPAAP